MAEKQIFDSVSIKIADVNRKHRRQLRLPGQRHPFETRTSVEKYSGLKFRGLKNLRFFIARPEDILDGHLAKGLMGRETSFQFWKTRRQPKAIMHRKPISAAAPGFNQLDGSV